MPEGPVTDALLMRDAALGNHASLEKLVRRNGANLLTFIERTVGDPHRSEDVFQDVFLIVWRQRRQYRYPRPFKPWLYRIALNRCRLEWRTSAPTVTFPDYGPAANDPQPSEAVITQESACVVRSAVERLPEQQRAVLVLRIWNSLSYHEIAEIVGRREATVRSYMHHALAAMRTYLEPRLR